MQKNALHLSTECRYSTDWEKAKKAGMRGMRQGDARGRLRKWGEGCQHTYSLGLGGGVDELLAEDLPVGVIGSLLDDDLLVVVGELEDNVLVLLVELQVIVGGYALLGNGRTDGRWLARAQTKQSLFGYLSLSLSLPPLFPATAV